MEEPAKPGKGEKKRATKTVIGTRERRTQGEPVVEGEAVVGKAEAETGCDGMAGAASGAGQAVVGGRKLGREREVLRRLQEGGARRGLDRGRVRPGKDGAREA